MPRPTDTSPHECLAPRVPRPTDASPHGCLAAGAPELLQATISSTSRSEPDLVIMRNKKFVQATHDVAMIRSDLLA